MHNLYNTFTVPCQEHNQEFFHCVLKHILFVELLIKSLHTCLINRPSACPLLPQLLLTRLSLFMVSNVIIKSTLMTFLRNLLWGLNCTHRCVVGNLPVTEVVRM